MKAESDVVTMPAFEKQGNMVQPSLIEDSVGDDTLPDDLGFRSQSRQTPEDPGLSALDDTLAVSAPAKERKIDNGFLLYEADGKKLRIFLTEGDTRLGSRLQRVDFVLPSHHISRLHAIFRRRGRSYFVLDNNSTNGTFVNGSEERIPSGVEVPLHDGDTVRLANMEFRFHSGEMTEEGAK